MLVSRDVTETVAAEAVLKEAKEAAERANAAKSEFMSRMSHELRTPLNSVLGFAQILEMELTSPDELEMVGYIHNSGKYLLELINEVLDISRIESGHITVMIEPIVLKDLESECIETRDAPGQRSRHHDLLAGRLRLPRARRPTASEAGSAEPLVQRDQVQPSERRGDDRVRAASAARSDSR